MILIDLSNARNTLFPKHVCYQKDFVFKFTVLWLPSV